MAASQVSEALGVEMTGEAGTWVMGGAPPGSDKTHNHEIQSINASVSFYVVISAQIIDD